MIKIPFGKPIVSYSEFSAVLKVLKSGKYVHGKKTVEFEKPRGKEAYSPFILNAEEFIAIKGFKAMGNQLTDKKLKSVILKEKLPYTPPEEESLEEIEVIEEETLKANTPQTRLDI